MKIDTRTVDALPFPNPYRILPDCVRLEIPGFGRDNQGGGWTLAFDARPCAEWFDKFTDQIITACGRRFLPICRLSDGEYRFFLGNQFPSSRLPVGERLAGAARQAVSAMRHAGNFRANTRPSISSGQYSRAERSRARELYPEYIRTIASEGILALHLSFGPRPFQEQYFPSLKRWMDRSKIQLHSGNYVPFYFVYAILTGPRRGELLDGRRVLVVHSATGERRTNITNSLAREGARVVGWCPISPTRSLFDRLDPACLQVDVDLVLVGAGVGKPNILIQLAPLRVPCIDAGYVFEAWADPSCARLRPYCLPGD